MSNIEYYNIQYAAGRTISLRSCLYFAFKRHSNNIIPTILTWTFSCYINTCKFQSGQRTNCSRFDYDNVASCQTSRHFPGEHHQRVIPRSNQSTNSHWFTSCNGNVSIGSCMVDRNSVSLNLVTPIKNIV